MKNFVGRFRLSRTKTEHNTVVTMYNYIYCCILRVNDAYILLETKDHLTIELNKLK